MFLDMLFYVLRALGICKGDPWFATCMSMEAPAIQADWNLFD